MLYENAIYQKKKTADFEDYVCGQAFDLVAVTND